MPKYATKARQKGPSGGQLHSKPKPPISDLIEKLYDLEVRSDYIYTTKERKIFPQAEDAAIVTTKLGNFTVIVLPQDFVAGLKITYQEMHGMFSYRFKSGNRKVQVATFNQNNYIKGNGFLLWTPSWNKSLVNKLKKASSGL